MYIATALHLPPASPPVYVGIEPIVSKTLRQLALQRVLQNYHATESFPITLQLPRRSK